MMIASQKSPTTGVVVIFQDLDIQMYACVPEKHYASVV